MATPTAPQILKRELRKQIRAKLSSLPVSQITQESNQTITRLLSTPHYQSARNIALYSSMPHEFDTTTLISDSFTHEKQVFLPLVTSKSRHEMVFLQVHSLSDLSTLPKNSWGIREPPLGQGRLQAPQDCQLDLIIVPGLAFDLHGGRCGQGMGFYDTFLANYAQSDRKMPKLIALALRVQIVSEVPVTDSDWRVDSVMYAED